MPISPPPPRPGKDICAKIFNSICLQMALVRGLILLSSAQEHPRCFLSYSKTTVSAKYS